MIIYTFPNKDEVLQRLIKAALMPDGDILDVLVRFSQMIGGQQRNAYGVNIGFQLAAAEIANRPGSMPMLAGLLNVEYDDLLTGVINDNPEFLAEVIAAHAEIMEKVRGAQS